MFGRKSIRDSHKRSDAAAFNQTTIIDVRHTPRLVGRVRRKSLLGVCSLDQHSATQVCIGIRQTPLPPPPPPFFFPLFFYISVTLRNLFIIILGRSIEKNENN